MCGQTIIFAYLCDSFFQFYDMQVIRLKGKEARLYKLIAPLVMDPNVIRANNNYPFKTDDKYVWFVALDDEEVKGFMPVEQRTGKRAIINNYYASGSGVVRQEVLSLLIETVHQAFAPEEWILYSVTLIDDKELFERFKFAPINENWKRYVRMCRQ